LLMLFKILAIVESMIGNFVLVIHFNSFDGFGPV
jgi:hypothetical protein